ncbi:hypothetical protein VVD49_12955 [Uliginosibacterium sp. H3]|uniref:Uncharacterized protein n=1 Tax=Uliginosibacterium silvisoli TaxID=3114758 RepID=A0ABU6K6H7_9RHOO|nr:hypothetical protein [Uliginosibacterium sp. H3]
MNTKPASRDQMLYGVVDEVLHYVWDPIGISRIPQARDEYHAYLPQVFALLIGNADEEGIASYLHETATGRMGLPADLQREGNVARVLMEWRRVVNEKFSGPSS